MNAPSRPPTGKNHAAAARPLSALSRPLERKAFVTSRLADFASKEELTLQIGHEPGLWPEVILKELLDNALDECERAAVAPEIAITVADDSISVKDTGGGIAAKVVKQILDYKNKTSSNAAYVSPTRGQQGNALQTLLAMSQALTGKPGLTVIESRGVRHRVTFAVDPISRVPRLDHQAEAIDNAGGTKVTIFLPVSPEALLDRAQIAKRFDLAARVHQRRRPSQRRMRIDPAEIERGVGKVSHRAPAEPDDLPLLAAIGAGGRQDPDKTRATR